MQAAIRIEVLRLIPTPVQETTVIVRVQIGLGLDLLVDIGQALVVDLVKEVTAAARLGQ